MCGAGIKFNATVSCQCKPENSGPSTMWLKILCVGVIVSSAVAKKDVFLQSMYGLEGRNKMEICVRTASGWRRCEAALCSRDWMLARARCLGLAPLANLTALRPSLGGSCSEGNLSTYSSRRVYNIVLHPWFDLALLVVLSPYYNLDQHANFTKITNKLRPHGVYRWMKYYMNAPCYSRNPSVHHNRLAKNQIVLHYPLWYFSISMVLPTALYMLFFIYVTFYTGSSCGIDEKSTNKKLQYSKKVTHV